MSKSNNAKRIAIGAVIAGTAGYLAGLLTAPKSGKETRADIKTAASKSFAEAEKELKKLHTELAKLLDKAKHRKEELSGKALAELNTLLEKTKDAKEKTRQMLSAIHEGDADDQDLAKAIQDANAAIDHLKEYLKK